jgi:hypothetical protein
MRLDLRLLVLCNLSHPGNACSRNPFFWNAQSSCTVDGTDAVGFRNTPVNSQSADYTLVLADSGKTILHPVADDNARTFTIPANSSVAYPVGTVISFVNLHQHGDDCNHDRHHVLSQ